MRPIFTLLFCTIVLTFVASVVFNYGHELQFVYTGLLVIALFYACDSNTRATVYIFIGLAFLDTLVFSLVNLFPKDTVKPVFLNMMLLSCQLTLDMIAIYLIRNKQVFLLKVSGNKIKNSPEVINSSIIDAPLIGVFVLFCLIDILCSAENIIRNLEHFGVPESFAKQFWNWDWFYYASQPIKLCLQALTIMVLFAGIYITRSRAARGEKPLSYDDCSTSN